MTGVRSRFQPEVMVAETTAKAASLSTGRCRVGLCPHAPYSTTPGLLSRCAETARARGWRVTTHVAESDEEYEMFRQARGPMFDWLSRNERDMTDCGGRSPLAALECQGLLGPDLLAVHANYLDSGDVERLVRQKVSVVHCPRSHAYFEHRPFPYPSLTRAGINVCLGTDSLATVVTSRHEPVRLDLFAEMRAFAAAFPGVAPREILRLCTTCAATALGLQRRIGKLARGMFADLIALPFSGDPASLDEAVLDHRGPVHASMIDGEWALAPGSAG
jgi:cytosine/adenosine deaminase-related metal-dependent hydrolase